jgi:RNase P protein component
VNGTPIRSYAGQETYCGTVCFQASVQCWRRVARSIPELSFVHKRLVSLRSYLPAAYGVAHVLASCRRTDDSQVVAAFTSELGCLWGHLNSINPESMAFGVVPQTPRQQPSFFRSRTTCCFVQRTAQSSPAVLRAASALSWNEGGAQRPLWFVPPATGGQSKHCASGSLLIAASDGKPAHTNLNRQRSGPAYRPSRDTRRGGHHRAGGRPQARRSEQQCFVLVANPCRRPTQRPIIEVRASKAVFGKRATVRTRARRRLRAAARQVLVIWGRSDFSYVIHGLPECLFVSWKDLLQEMMEALQRSGCAHEKARAPPRLPQHPHDASSSSNGQASAAESTKDGSPAAQLTQTDEKPTTDAFRRQ